MIQKFVTQQIKILNKSLFLNYDKRDKKSNNYISITPITWKVGRANKKVVVLCIKHPHQIFNNCANIKLEKNIENQLCGKQFHDTGINFGLEVFPPEKMKDK